ncbi:MAG: RNA polymerase sigma factor [Pyrinomonadaceae bacterium]
MNSNKTNRPDEELARRAAEGDAAAFEEIHSRYRRLVYSIALRMTRNPADAEDLTQESFISVLRHVGSFRGEAAFASWLYRLTVNQVKMHFRRRSKRPEGQMSVLESAERASGFERGVSPVRIIDRLIIEQALQKLPPGSRAALLLHDVVGYEHKEIGRRLGYSEGNSKSQLHRARAKLRKLISAQSPALQP